MASAARASPGSPTSSRTLHITLWVVQGLLALAFLGAGATKVFTPHDALAASMPWVADAPAWVPALAGGSELLGVLGLLLPSLTRIKPALTPLAALGLVVVMILAAGLHASRGEMAMVPPSAVLGALAAFVAWGRFKAVPIAPRA